MRFIGRVTDRNCGKRDSRFAGKDTKSMIRDMITVEDCQMRRVYLDEYNIKCKYCNGKGSYWVPNGPDDIDREICEECCGRGFVWFY